MKAFLNSLRKGLKDSSDPKTKASSQRFFKGKIILYGVRSKEVGVITREYFSKIRHLSKQGIFKYCEELYKSGYEEESWIASNWVYELHEKFEKSDIEIFKRWIEKYVDDWAKCDVFCNHTMGALIEMYPELISDLKVWARSSDKWLKRASAVSLILPARDGKYLQDIFEIANILLLDKEDMVQKGYGWMLKEASRKHQKDVFDYVVAHKDVMPRTALRYAIEKMPKELKIEAMKK